MDKMPSRVEIWEEMNGVEASETTKRRLKEQEDLELEIPTN